MYSQRSKKAFIVVFMLIVLFGTMGNLCADGAPNSKQIDSFANCEYRDSIVGGQIPICRKK